MLSRVAESIYWMSRYVERAENVARFVDVALQLALDLPSVDQWGPLVATTADEAGFRARHGTATEERVVDFLAFDRDNPSSIASCLFRARENARSVREIISSEMWEQVNGAWLAVSSDEARALAHESPHDFFVQMKQASHLFVGITHLTMTHNEAWHFARLGRLLERADQTSRIVDVKYFLLLPGVADVGTVVDEVSWAAVLRSASALEMYRKAEGPILPARVVDFLLREEHFPRSVRYCLREGMRSLATIVGDTDDDSPAEHALGKVHASVEYADTTEVIKDGLHEFIDRLQTGLNRADDCIAKTFF